MSKVGYKKPPVGSQFKPGQSGNPRGRPKGSFTLSSYISKELDRRVTIVENGRERKYSLRHALAKTLVTKAVKGDVKASEIVQKLEAQSTHKSDNQRSESVLSPEAEQAILDRFAKRQNGGD